MDKSPLPVKGFKIFGLIRMTTPFGGLLRHAGDAEDFPQGSNGNLIRDDIVIETHNRDNRLAISYVNFQQVK
jgi:hypothetical protein